MLPVATAAALYKEFNLTVVWGKKTYIYICIYKKGSGLSKVSEDVIQVGLNNSFYGQQACLLSCVLENIMLVCLYQTLQLSSL